MGDLTESHAFLQFFALAGNAECTDLLCVTEVIYLVFITHLQNKIVPALPQLSLSHHIRMQYLAKKNHLKWSCSTWISQEGTLEGARLFYRASVRPCGDVKLFIATGWVLEVLLVVHSSPSSACWLEKKNAVAEGRIHEQDTGISCQACSVC